MSEVQEEKIVCCVCGKLCKCMTYSHLQTHQMTFDEYRERFPDAKLTSEARREISRLVGRRNKGRTSWCKGRRLSPEHCEAIRQSHWSRRPYEETIEIRKAIAANGSSVMLKLNEDGKAFRMPKGYHTQEYKDRMRQLMSARVVTWGDKIRQSHWSHKNADEVSRIVEKIQHNGTPQHFARGWYYSSKMEDEFFFMSSFERRRMEFLDVCETVLLWTNKHKIWLDYEVDGQPHRYNPDFLVIMTDGRVRIEEIKGVILERDVIKTAAKESVCREFAQSCSWEYYMLFENDLEVI